MPEPGVFACWVPTVRENNFIRACWECWQRERRGNGKGVLGSHNRKVGYLEEERGLYPKYNIYNQLKYFATLKGMKPSEIKLRWTIGLNV